MTPDLELITSPAPEPSAVEAFVEAMSALASGVVLVTCRLEGRPWGMTVTAFASVSAEPPTVLVSLGAASPAARAIAATGGFGVSILSEHQLAVAQLGSMPGAAKFLDRLVEDDGSRRASPVVAGALAHLDCELVDQARVADHTVIFGRVRDARSASAGSPLVHFRRAYQTLAELDRARQSITRSIR